MGMTNTSATVPKPMAMELAITDGFMLNEYNTSELANAVPVQ